MNSILTIYFPDDFEKHYKQYKALLENGKVEIPEENEPAEDTNEKYSSEKEDIALKSVGIEIKGNSLLKGESKFKLNATDRKIIDFLHYRFLEEKEMCSDVTVLEKQLGKAGGYIKNRVSLINNGVKKLISEHKRTSIDDFIKYESGRGYRLNPRFVIKITKNK